MYLVLRLRGDIGDNDRGVACSIEGRGQVVAHQAGVPTFAWLRELDLGQQPVALRMKHRSNGHLQLDAELTSRNRRTHQINGKRREAVLAPWDGWEAARSFTGRCFGAGFGLEGRTLHPTR